MNLFIIGSDSFIARHFIKIYDAQYIIHSVSRIPTGFEKEVVLSDYNSIPESFFQGVDVVLNFAAIVHKPKATEILYDEINYYLVIKNAEKAKINGVRLFVQMSTISVYGQTSIVTINSIENPKNAYGRSKSKADNKLLEMQNDFFKVAIIRPPMVYGGGNAPGNMMRLIKLVEKRIPLPFKCIDNQRDFINMSNLVQYLTIVLEKRLNGIFIISDHEPVSTEYLLKLIAKYLNKRIILFHPSKYFLTLLKKVALNEYNKLYGSIHVQTNFPYEELIYRHSINDGIMEMVDYRKTISDKRFSKL